MKEIHNVEQKSEEWFKLKEKYPLSASEGQAIGNAGKGLETLCYEVLSKKYSKGNNERISNKDTERGNELEPLARHIYELRNNCKVIEVGFVTDEGISKVGGVSPDGDVLGTDGLVEFKAFADQKHFETICEFNETGTFKVESKYEWQTQMQMLFTGKKWVDFCPYNPNYKESLLTVRIYRDEEKIQAIREGLKKGEELLNNIEKNYVSK